MDNRQGYAVVYVDGKVVDLRKYCNTFDECVEKEEYDCSWMKEPFARIVPDGGIPFTSVPGDVSFYLCEDEDKAVKLKNLFCCYYAFSDAVDRIIDGKADNVVMAFYYTDNNESNGDWDCDWPEYIAEYWVFKKK
ncbi:MAG: hypothetical protein ACI4EN_01105 [Butyrivibrio sp.]